MNRKYITKLAFAIVILCFVLSTFVSLWSLRHMMQQNMREISKSLAARIYDTISGELSEPVTVSQTMANDCFLIDVLKDEPVNGTEETAVRMARYLSGLKEALSYEAAFVVSEGSKNYYSFNGLNKQMDLEKDNRDRWYTDFIASGKDYDVDVDRDEVSRDMLTVFVDTRIKDENGNLLGACGVGLRLTGIQELFGSLEKEYGVRISLADPEGVIQLDADESRIQNARIDVISTGQGDDYTYHKLGSGRYVLTKYVERLGWYLVVESDGSRERSTFIDVLLLNVVMCGIVLIIMLLSIRIIIARTRALTSASFTDQATQLLNRRAFEEKKAEMALSPLDEDFVYVTADLNGLKQVNDNIGHAAGDELIKGAADCLKECFGKYGDIYRIGGDEFAAMLNITKEQLDEAAAKLEEVTANWEGTHTKGLTISCGYAPSKDFPSENLAELSRISDERMYAAKDEYYRRTRKRRR